MANKKDSILLNAIISHLTNNGIDADNINSSYANVIYEDQESVVDLKAMQYTVYWTGPGRPPERVGAYDNEYILFPIFAIQVIYAGDSSVDNKDIQQEMLNHKADLIELILSWDYKALTDAEGKTFVDDLVFVDESKLPSTEDPGIEPYEVNFLVQYNNNGVF